MVNGHLCDVLKNNKREKQEIRESANLTPLAKQHIIKTNSEKNSLN